MTIEAKRSTAQLFYASAGFSLLRWCSGRISGYNFFLFFFFFSSNIHCALEYIIESSRSSQT